MVQGLAFLSKKGFNPHNQVNRKAVYEAQQHSKIEQERAQKRQEQLRKEEEDEEFARARHGQVGGAQAQLRFMYDAPPGLQPKQPEHGEEKTTTTKKTGHSVDVTQMQPGDDAAAAAFRRMLAASTTTTDNNNSDKTEQDDDTQETPPANDSEPKLSFGAVLQGSTMDPIEQQQENKKLLKEKGEKETSALSALEKAVGRRDRGGALTLEDQVARFPQLKNAPMAKGMSSTDVNVSFKPLGSQMRNVKCLSCGVWGHSRGDRECAKSGWNPFQLSSTTMNLSSAAAAAAVPTTTAAANATTATNSSILPIEKTSVREKRKHRDHHDDSSSSSSSSSDSDSSEDSGHKRRKHKHRHKSRSSSKRKRKHPKESSSSRRHKRRSRSPESPSRKSRKSSSSHKKHHRHSSREHKDS